MMKEHLKRVHGNFFQNVWKDFYPKLKAYRKKIKDFLKCIMILAS